VFLPVLRASGEIDGGRVVQSQAVSTAGEIAHSLALRSPPVETALDIKPII
jgi:hypothetical protein